MNIIEFHKTLTDKGVYGFFDAWVEEGWQPMVLELVDKLMAAGWSGNLAQIKEKFGGLRFYPKTIENDLYPIIEEYCNKSYTICEYCGQPGKVSSNHGWLKTLCSEHEE